MHQPRAAIAPSTVLQDEGASNSAQFSQRSSTLAFSATFDPGAEGTDAWVFGANNSGCERSEAEASEDWIGR
jgi:hypothetical protein